MDLAELKRGTLGRLRPRGNAAAAKVVPLAEYARRHIRLRRGPFSFAGHEYLRAIYDDVHPRLVFMKAAQLGLSTYHIIRAAWLARYAGAKTLYFLPTDAMARLFARERVPALLAGEAGRRVAVTSVAAGTLIFHGLLSDAAVRGQDADFVVLDELDAAAPARAALAEDRLLHSPLAWLSRLSTPTLPGAGVAKLFEESDQRRWLVRCGACRWEGDLAAYFPACLEGARGRARTCPRCGRAVDTARGRWVAAYPSRRACHGYHLSHLFTGLAAAEIRRQYQAAAQPYERQRFYNSVLGLPYLPPGASLDDAALAAACGDHDIQRPRAATYAGVDVGDTIHAVAAELAAGTIKVVAVAALEGFDELARFLDDYRAARAVIDAMPYKASAVELARRRPGRVVLAYFRDRGYGAGVEKCPGGYVATLSLERTAAIDRTVAYLKDGRIKLPKPAYPAVQTLLRHVKALRRTVEERADGSLRAKWLSGGADHFAMALTYLVAAAEMAPAPADVSPQAAFRRTF